MPNFTGLFATPVTAFDRAGKVDPEGIRNLVNFVAEKGIENLFCLGSWGGFVLMDTDERTQAAKAYLDSARSNNMPCIINVSATTPEKAIYLAKHAKDNGAFAVASLVPYYYSSSGYTEKNVLNYFEALISEVAIPVHFYNNPRTTGYRINIELFMKFIDIGGSGMKEGGGDPSAFIEMMDVIKQRNISFDMIPGSVTMFLTGLMYGVKATMIGSAVVFPELAKSAWDAWKEKDTSKAAAQHALLMKVRRIQSSFGMGAAASYGLLALRGIDIGKPRAPWIGLEEEEKKNLQIQLRKLGLPI